MQELKWFFTEDFPDEPPSYFNFTGDDLGDNTTQPMRAKKAKMLNYMDEVEIVYQSPNVLNGSENHPMHLHGHSFYVLASGAGAFDCPADSLRYNFVDPPYMNTAILPKNRWLAVRFRANNLGVWLWHCHYDRHLSWGMNTVFIVRDGGMPETSMRDPPANMPTCGDSFALLSPRVNSLVES